MINEFKRLWRNKRSSQGRVDITAFFINVFLIMCHTFFLIVSIIVGHKFMIYVTLIALIIHISFFCRCHKMVNKYLMFSYVEIWFHMLCAIISFGWTPCFQNWSFALVAAYFLPSFTSEEQKHHSKKAFIFTFTIITTYFLLSVLIYVIDFKTMHPLNDIMNRLLFTINNFISFFAIMMFAYFYTAKSKRKEIELSRKADYDELTKLYNRHAINQISTRIIQESKKLNKPYNVAILDIDFFKKVNDTYGHTSGDMVLKQIASILKFYLNKGIYSGRWGGEEFVLISSGEISYSDFTDILEKLRIKVSKTKFSIEKNKKINLTISIGASYSETNINLEDAITEADSNLYEAKNTGRNKLVKKEK